MHKFKDKTGKTWEVEINVAAIKRVRNLLDLDIYALVEDGCKPLGKFLADPVKLIDTLYVLCKAQADESGFDDEAFGRGFSGDSLEEAGNAFLGELIDFFPNREGRNTLQQVLKQGERLGSLLLDRTKKQIAEMDLEKELDRLVESFTERSGSTPASSASTPAHSPSAN